VNLKTATLQRTHTGKMGTYGILGWNGLPLCVTLEDPPLGNQRRISCIPAGKYTVVPHSGQKFKDVWRLEDVPGRDGILIHIGNSIADTEGCILVGLGIGSPGITNSGLAMTRLKETLPPMFNLIINDPVR
jgi:hypothetical protein